MSYVTTGQNLDDMMAEVRDLNTKKGWRVPGAHTFGDYIALLHSELSEALEAYRDYRLADATGRLRVIQSALGSVESEGQPTKPEGVGSEFADVLIRLLDVCDVYGIDLDAEYRRKIAYNWTRPYQHGGRTLSDVGQAK